MPTLLDALAEGWRGGCAAADVMCVAIGVNLLLPMAPAFLRCFLDGVDIAPDSIVRNHFSGKKDVCEDDLKKIGVAAKRIADEKGRCHPLSWGWVVADIVAAAIGIAALWCGVAGVVGRWAALLFLPPIAAVVWSIVKYKRLKGNLTRAIAEVEANVKDRENLEGEFVRNFAAGGMRALE